MTTTRKRRPIPARSASTRTLSVDKLLNVSRQLQVEEDLTVDQQHQLRTVNRYLELEPDSTTPHGQAALRCAELLLDGIRLKVYQRRFGVES